MNRTFNGIRAGDVVAYYDRFDKVRTGRAQALLLFPTHVVVDAGGGRPVVVNRDNFAGNRSAHLRPVPAAWSAPSSAPIPGMKVSR
jgi:hypothetical protein